MGKTKQQKSSEQSKHKQKTLAFGPSGMKVAKDPGESDELKKFDELYLQRITIRTAAYAILMALHFHSIDEGGAAAKKNSEDGDDTKRTGDSLCLTKDEIITLAAPYCHSRMIDSFTHESNPQTNGEKVSAWHEGIRTVEKSHEFVACHKGSKHRYKMTTCGKKFVKRLLKERAQDIVNEYEKDSSTNKKLLENLDVEEARKHLSKKPTPRTGTLEQYFKKKVKESRPPTSHPQGTPDRKRSAEGQANAVVTPLDQETKRRHMKKEPEKDHASESTRKSEERDL